MLEHHIYLWSPSKLLQTYTIYIWFLLKIFEPCAGRRISVKNKVLLFQGTFLRWQIKGLKFLLINHLFYCTEISITGKYNFIFRTYCLWRMDERPWEVVHCLFVTDNFLAMQRELHYLKLWLKYAFNNHYNILKTVMGMVEVTAQYFSHFFRCLMWRFQHWMFPCSVQNAHYNLNVLYHI